MLTSSMGKSDTIMYVVLIHTPSRVMLEVVGPFDSEDAANTWATEAALIMWQTMEVTKP
jgi:hypothetical protein